MNYYAVQVWTGAEQQYITSFRAQNPELRMPIYFPQRALEIRRDGKMTPARAAIFPGYIFIELEGENALAPYHHAFRQVQGFCRFLRSNQDIVPLAGRDLEMVLHFIKGVGPVAGRSRVMFDENARIVVIDGPLRGLEGRIFKVDRRKCRAKVKLDLYDDSFAIDLAFEVLEKAPEPKRVARGRR